MRAFISSRRTRSTSETASRKAASTSQPLPDNQSFALGPGEVSLHPEFPSILRLNSAHQQKVYYSDRLWTRVEREIDGEHPAENEGWVDVWCQLSGVTLCIWTMQAIEDARVSCEHVQPQYINVADALVQLIDASKLPDSYTMPCQGVDSILTLNTAGSNLFIFACESQTTLLKWLSAFLVACWEKSRLEEIYTAQLLRISFTENGEWREPPTTLGSGHTGVWASVRIAGQTNWRRLWVVVSTELPVLTKHDAPTEHQSAFSPNSAHLRSTSNPASPKKGRLSGLLSRSKTRRNSGTSGTRGVPTILFYYSDKLKDRKTPMMSLSNVFQAFAVYPERPDLVTQNTMVKIEGLLGDEEGAGSYKGTEAWLLALLEVGSGQATGLRRILEWVVGVHDTFKLYGRPSNYSFDPQNAVSLMYAYPTGLNINHLFLGPQLVESWHSRELSTSTARSQLTNILQEYMRPSILPVASSIRESGRQQELVRGPQLANDTTIRDASEKAQEISVI
ncbi:hypothetical protein BDV93DRAFT_494874, partial [Ceratobasidium sp. AG-I]